MQKKAYRVLEEVCAAPHAPCQAFVRSHLQDLQAALLDSLKSAASPAKRVRARAVLVVISHCWEGSNRVGGRGNWVCVLGCTSAGLFLSPAPAEMPVPHREAAICRARAFCHCLGPRGEHGPCEELAGSGCGSGSSGDMPVFLQVILCTKEVSVGARKSAFMLLVEMGHAFIRFGPTPEGELLFYLLSPTVTLAPGRSDPWPASC